MTDVSTVESIALPDAQAGPWTEAAEDPGSGQRAAAGEVRALIDQGFLLVFDDACSDQAAEDVTNSVLLSQLAADKRGDRRADPSGWWTVFSATLANLSWTTGGYAFASSEQDPQIDWRQSLEALLSGQARHLGGIGIEACRRLPPTSRAFGVWSQAALGDGKGMLVVGACGMSGGSPVLMLAAVGFELETWAGTLFDGKVTYRLRSSSCTCELNESLYAKIRQAVVNKLGDRPRTLVVAVPVDHG